METAQKIVKNLINENIFPFKVSSVRPDGWYLGITNLWVALILLMASVFTKLMLLLNIYVPCKETVNYIFICISVNSSLYECDLNLLLWKCLIKIFLDDMLKPMFHI